MAFVSDIRALGPGDLDAFMAMRSTALADTPGAFGSSPAADRFADTERCRETLAASARGETQVVYGGFVAEDLAGICGLVREVAPKARHRAFIWGMFVAPEARGNGLGRRLIDRSLSHARGMDGVIAVSLGVTAAHPAARRLYESAGFEIWGTDPAAIHVEGAFLDEHHMIHWIADRPASIGADSAGGAR